MSEQALAIGVIKTAIDDLTKINKRIAKANQEDRARTGA